MSYQDPPRRQRVPRYPALAQYEDSDQQPYQGTQAGYRYRGGTGRQDGHTGFAGLASRDTGQRPPWEDPAQQTAWDTPEQRTAWYQVEQEEDWQDPGQQTRWDTPAQTVADLPRRTSGPFFAVSDDEDEDTPVTTVRRGRGRLAGAVAGFLAAAVSLGVANLIAAFVRPQASPIIAVGEAFIDRTPPALKNFAVQKFGENDKNMLLLGMYVTIAIIAIVIGMLAWRRISVGVAGIGLFGLFGAFVAITRPESHVTDVIPSIVGGIAGIATIVWLIHMGAGKFPGAAGAARTAAPGTTGRHQQPRDGR
jgi:hypothetical protein